MEVLSDPASSWISMCTLRETVIQLSLQRGLTLVAMLLIPAVAWLTLIERWALHRIHSTQNHAFDILLFLQHWHVGFAHRSDFPIPFSRPLSLWQCHYLHRHARIGVRLVVADEIVIFICTLLGWLVSLLNNLSTLCHLGQDSFLCEHLVNSVQEA